MSIRDLARLFVALQDGRVLSRSSTERMWTAARLTDGSTIPHALGWTMTQLGSARAVGHEGGGCAWLTHVPEERLSVVALCNLAGSGADAMTDDLARQIAGAGQR
jgi:CubicO group peptidase (beta-lactamase class C family)